MIKKILLVKIITTSELFHNLSHNNHKTFMYFTVIFFVIGLKAADNCELEEKWFSRVLKEKI